MRLAGFIRVGGSDVGLKLGTGSVGIIDQSCKTQEGGLIGLQVLDLDEGLLSLG